MLDKPQVTRTLARTDAVIRLVIAREEIRNVMGPSFAEGHRAAPNLWECYVAGPESSANPADWRTELNRPLIT